MLGHIILTINSVMSTNLGNFEWYRIIALLSSNISTTCLAEIRRVIISESWKILSILIDIKLGNTMIAFLVQIKDNICKKPKRREWNRETTKWYKNLEKGR